VKKNGTLPRQRALQLTVHNSATFAGKKDRRGRQLPQPIEDEKNNHKKS